MEPIDQEIYEQLLNSKILKEEELLLEQNLYEAGTSPIRALGKSYYVPSRLDRLQLTNFNFIFDCHVDMKFSMEDIKSVDRKRSIDQKLRKSAKKKAHVGSPADPPTIVPLLEGTLMLCSEDVLAIAGMKVV